MHAWVAQAVGSSCPLSTEGRVGGIRVYLQNKKSGQAPNFLPMRALGKLGCPVRGAGGEGILFLKQWGRAVSWAFGEGLLEAAEGTGCSMECHSAPRIQCCV